MNKNIAVVGCGYWGKNLVRNFAELGVLHTICDNEPRQLAKHKAIYPWLKTETDYSSVLANDEVMGVVLATPAPAHHSMARQALLAGKDTFVEKPLALSLADGEELVRLAEERSRVLMVGHVLEYHPAVTRLKELIDKGELGKIQYIYSNRLNLGKFRTEENILWSFAPHDIAVILLLLGGEMPVEVSARGGNYLNNDITDVTMSTMSFKSGAGAHIFVSWLHPYKEQRLVVVGDRKMAEFNDGSAEAKLRLFSHEIGWVGRLPVANAAEPEAVDIPMAEPLKLECEDFIKCMKSRAKPRTDGLKGLQVLKVLTCCQKSLAANGRVIVLQPQNPGFFIHETSILEEPYSIGEGTRIWHFCHLMPSVVVGSNCVIGQNVFIGNGVGIGNNVKIENNVSVFEGVTLEDDVFCGPACVFTNVINPRSQLCRRHEFKPTLVKKGATIGANATIVCGNTIGRYAFIGAGAVVTRDIPDYAMAYGNPAQIHDWVCECGTKLRQEKQNLKCPGCGKAYQIEGQKCLPVAGGEPICQPH